MGVRAAVRCLPGDRSWSAQQEGVTDQKRTQTVKIRQKLEARIKTLNLCKSSVLLPDPHIQTDLRFCKGQQDTAVLPEREVGKAIVSEGLGSEGVGALAAGHTWRLHPATQEGHARFPRR